MKQERLRQWLQRKEAEEAARRRERDLQARCCEEEQRLAEQRREEREADLREQRRRMANAATRRSRELQLQLYCAAETQGQREGTFARTSGAKLAAAFDVYGRPPPRTSKLSGQRLIEGAN